RELLRQRAGAEASLSAPVRAARSQTVLDLVSRVAARQSDALAVTDATRSMRYGELAFASDALGTELQSNGIGRGSVVGVALDRSVELVVAILGTMKAGAAVLPVAPGYPDARRR